MSRQTLCFHLSWSIFSLLESFLYEANSSMTYAVRYLPGTLFYNKVLFELQ